VGYYSFKSVLYLDSHLKPRFGTGKVREKGMHTQNTNTRTILLSELPPKTLIETTYAIIRIRRTLPIWNPVKEMAIIRPLLPHPLHLRTTWLEIAEILLSQTRLFVDFDTVAREWTR
jgi:hypothetical protein